MTTLHQIAPRCPACGTRFLSRTVVSTSSSGGERTDAHEDAHGATVATRPLPHVVHTCDRCGGALTAQDLTEEASPDHSPRERTRHELVPRLPSESPAVDFPHPGWGRGRVSHAAYMRVQAALMPRGAELAWIEQHSAAYRAWVERFAQVSDEGPPTISEETLRRLARENFVAARHHPVRARSSPARKRGPSTVALDQSLVEAARTLDLDDVRDALSLGADPGATGPRGNTALHYLALGRSMVAAAAFTEVAVAGGDVHRRNDAGVTPADIVRGAGTPAMKAALARAEQRGRSLGSRDLFDQGSCI